MCADNCVTVAVQSISIIRYIALMWPSEWETAIEREQERECQRSEDNELNGMSDLILWGH